MDEKRPAPCLLYTSPAVELLAGIPSVVYGLIGVMVLVPAVMELFHLKNGTCLFAAILVLAIMILPVSYTHLDVYKRQPFYRPSRNRQSAFEARG